MKKKQRKVRLIRAAIQLIFFIAAPSLFSTAFAGVKSIFLAIGGQQSVTWNSFLDITALLLIITILFGRHFCGYACAFGSLGDALKGADIFIGVSAPNIVTPKMVASMNRDSILFAMANPIPEIMPDVAKAAGARVVGTGRSDFPNQVNNVVAFPGIFKGALEGRATQITEEMKLAAAEAIAGLVPADKLSDDNIMPEAFDPQVAEVVANAVKSHIR